MPGGDPGHARLRRALEFLAELGRGAAAAEMAVFPGFVAHLIDVTVELSAPHRSPFRPVST